VKNALSRRSKLRGWRHNMCDRVVAVRSCSGVAALAAGTDAPRDLSPSRTPDRAGREPHSGSCLPIEVASGGMRR